MTGSRRELGSYGENLAAEFLKRRNCNILAKNFKAGKNEIDLIIEVDREIAFIEVKTRSASFYGFPEYAVDRRKLKNIADCGHNWMNENTYRGFWRIDIISVEIKRHNKTAVIKWFKNLNFN